MTHDSASPDTSSDSSRTTTSANVRRTEGGPAHLWTTERTALLRLWVAESNEIENIYRDPTDAEIDAHLRFLADDDLTISGLMMLVADLEEGAILRQMEGRNVTVGGQTFPPPGGQRVLYALDAIVSGIVDGTLEPFEAHHLYETLHPFTDGNGRSGRALWLWQMLRHPDRYEADGALGYGFLRAFYYQGFGYWRSRGERPLTQADVDRIFAEPEE